VSLDVCILALLEAKCESAQPATVPANAGSTIMKGIQRGKWYKGDLPTDASLSFDADNTTRRRLNCGYWVPAAGVGGRIAGGAAPSRFGD
jgi:hypothetical protein